VNNKTVKEIKAKSMLHYHERTFATNWDANIYRGCEHNCKYCFAQYSHRYLESKEFFKDIFVMINAAEILAYELGKRKWNKSAVNVCGISDCYQPQEAKYKIMPNTVHSVFDHVRLYNSFMLASNAPFEKYAEREKQLLAQFSPKERELILSSGKYVGDQSYIIKEASHYPINKDWKPVTEYYLGLKFKEIFFLDR